jgi:hypothetical protein
MLHQVPLPNWLNSLLSPRHPSPSTREARQYHLHPSIAQALAGSPEYARICSNLRRSRLPSRVASHLRRDWTVHYSGPLLHSAVPCRFPAFALWSIECRPGCHFDEVGRSVVEEARRHRPGSLWESWWRRMVCEMFASRHSFYVTCASRLISTYTLEMDGPWCAWRVPITPPWFVCARVAPLSLSLSLYLSLFSTTSPLHTALFGPDSPFIGSIAYRRVRGGIAGGGRSEGGWSHWRMKDADARS